MSTSIGPESMDDAEKALTQMKEDHEKRIEATVKPWGRQIKGPLRVEFFEWMANEVFPPEPWITPDGALVMVSPWVAALPYVEGGEDEIREYMAEKQAAQGVM